MMTGIFVVLVISEAPTNSGRAAPWTSSLAHWFRRIRRAKKSRKPSPPGWGPVGALRRGGSLRVRSIGAARSDRVAFCV